MKKQKWLGFLLGITLSCLPLVVFGAKLNNPLGQDDLKVIIGRIINYILGFSGTLALLMFIWGGFTWMTSGGAEAKIKSGKDTLIWATIGLVVIFSAYALVKTLIIGITS